MQNKKHTLLLVDDLPQNLMALKSILEKDNREIISCLSGAEALQILLKRTISLILVDVQMPDMDGFEFVEILKSHPATSNIPTLFVTAISNETKFLNKAYDLGAIDFLFKPLNTEITRKKVDSFLRIWDYDQELKGLNEKLKEKNKELENFAHIIAHDLKTPLSNIRSLIDVIEEDFASDFKEQASQLFDLVKTSSNSMARLIDDLLSYTKNVQINEGKENVNILTVVEKIITLLNPPSHVHIEKVNLNNSIVFQPIALQQIISNLISNAIKYNDKDAVEIRIEFNSNEKTLAVKDNGQGIDVKYHTKVFEMFETLGKQSKGESSTGIGLTLVKKLVERNNANIAINKENSIGTEFIISNLELANN